MTSYPSFRYRDTATGEVESKKVESPEDEALTCPAEDGWRHSPDPDAPPSVDPATLSFVSARPLVAFPSIRYRTHPETGALESATVQDADEAALFEAEGWRESPEGLGEAPPQVARAAVAPTTRMFDPNIAGQPFTPEQDAKDAAELHAMRPAEFIARVLSETDPAFLMRAHKLEGSHPSVPGGRRKILNAINAQMQALAEDAARKAQGD